MRLIVSKEASRRDGRLPPCPTRLTLLCISNCSAVFTLRTNDWYRYSGIDISGVNGHDRKWPSVEEAGKGDDTPYLFRGDELVDVIAYGV